MSRMKFFQKKEVTLEKTPILFRLERRHTLLDGAKDDDTDGESKRVYRANSVGSYTRPSTPTNTKPDVTLSSQNLSNGNRSNYSAASSVVITESELSSSWLYNTRKAKLDSDEETTSTNSKVPTDDHDIQPVQLHDPDLKPVPVPLKKRPEKVSSCCCYLLVALTIFIASLGILAAIGGIIYLEIFAIYKESSEGKHANQELSLDSPINLKIEIDQSTLLPNKGWSLNGFQNLVGDSPVVQDFVDNIKNGEISSQNKDLLQETPLDEFGAKMSVSSTVDKSEDLKQLPEHDQLNKNVINHKDSLHKNNDVIEDILLVDGSNHEDNDKLNSSDLIDSISEETLLMETSEPVSNIVVSKVINGNDSNFEMENEQDEINTDSSNISNFDGLVSILNHQTNSRFPRLEQDDSIISHQSNSRLEQDILVNNSLEVDGYADDKLDENPDISVIDQEYENSFEIEPQIQKFFDDSSVDYDLVMNRPIVEAKPPIDFQRRLEHNQNKDLDQQSTIRNMDMKFSLSEILQHLRTLEVDNQSPSTRQSQKSVAETITSSMASQQDLGVEKNEYLNNLRRKLYV